MKQIETTAMQDCWKRLYSVVSKAAQKLNEPDAIFRDSLIENISDLCTMLPKLNVMEDPNLESMRQAIETTVGGINPDQVRDNAEVRKTAVQSLDEITSKMSAFMGIQS